MPVYVVKLGKNDNKNLPPDGKRYTKKSERTEIKCVPTMKIMQKKLQKTLALTTGVTTSSSFRSDVFCYFMPFIVCSPSSK